MWEDVVCKINDGMLKLFFLLPIIILLQACRSECKTSPVLADTSEKIYRDTTDGSLSILFDGKYIFSIGLNTYGMKPDSFISWTAGFYRMSGDTVLTFFPSDSSLEFKSLDTKYFYVDTTQGFFQVT